MRLEDQTRCEKSVFVSTIHSYQCTRKWKVERNGHRYCRQHDPAAIKARDEARHNKWRKQWNLQEKAHKNKQYAYKAIDTLLALSEKHPDFHYPQPYQKRLERLLRMYSKNLRDIKNLRDQQSAASS